MKKNDKKNGSEGEPLGYKSLIFFSSCQLKLPVPEVPVLHVRDRFFTLPHISKEFYNISSLFILYFF